MSNAHLNTEPEAPPVALNAAGQSKVIMNEPAIMFLWSTAETAKQLSVSKRTVERLIERGDLTAIRIGRSRRLNSADVHVWVKQLTNQERTAKEHRQERLTTLKITPPNSKGKKPHTPIEPSGKGDAIAEIWKRIAGYNAAKREKAGK